MSISRTARYQMILAALLVFTILAQGTTFASNSPASPQNAETKSGPERVTADTARVTPGGATFKFPPVGRS